MGHRFVQSSVRPCAFHPCAATGELLKKEEGEEEGEKEEEEEKEEEHRLVSYVARTTPFLTST